MTHATLGVYTSPRPKGFAPWKPQAKARELVESIEAVLAEYAAYLPITVRQIFYNLVSRGFLEKTDRAYAGLCEAANRARRAGLLPWNAFRDDGTTARVAAAYETPSAFLSALRRYVTDDYRRPRLTGQARALEVWSEAAGMVPQLERVCDPYGVAVYSSGGFDSLTAKHETASRLADESRPTVILHVGDLDPSGLTIFDALAVDVAAFVEGLNGAVVPSFVRLAVTPEQVDAMHLTTAPPKATDRRGGFTGETTQAEAIPPDVLAALVRDAIESRLDLDALADVRAAEQRDRARLLAAFRKVRL